MRIYTLLFLLLALGLLIAGCKPSVEQPAAANSTAEDYDADIDAEYNLTLENELNETLLPEEEDIDLGDMI